MAHMPVFTLVLLMTSAAFCLDPAAAQATRTWVSGVGDDVNPCSRTAPCKTFPGAISKTLAGGEINCLDPGGFGAVTITKSITIDCTGTMGGILNAATNGVNVNDSATGTPNTIKVILRGISIDGAGTTPGQHGIRFTAGASLVLEQVFVQNQKGQNGISITPSSGTPRIVINNTRVVNNGSATGAGLSILPTGTGGALVSITNSNFDNNTNGILASLAASTGKVVIDVADSSMSNNAQKGFSAVAGTGTLQVMATRVNASFNDVGFSEGGPAVIRIGSSTVTGNNTGIAGNNVRSYGNNQIIGNTTDGTLAAEVLN
jgi:hypothetical protein